MQSGCKLATAALPHWVAAGPQVRRKQSFDSRSNFGLDTYNLISYGAAPEYQWAR